MSIFKFFACLSRKKDRCSSQAENTDKTAKLPHGPLGFDDTKDDLNSIETEETHFSTSSSTGSTKPRAIYDGGYDHSKGSGIRLRIANGGAGQTGLVQAWADTFIQHMVAKGHRPFQVAWYMGDTTESLAFLSAGDVDVALTYNPAAEARVMRAGQATKCVYAFRDHFMLIGPKSNPACLADEDDILTMFSKIASCGNADVATPPASRPPTRFLSRFDKSATNIKESLIFATIGQVPWALDYSKWYHQYPRFPREALQAASLLSEYTLIDKGAWLDAPKSITSTLKIFKMGSDDADDPLLNPAHLLCAKESLAGNESIGKEFVTWVLSRDGGQKVIEKFSKNGKILYSKAP